MKIIVNTTNLFQGGGIQVGVSFINEIKIYKEIDFDIFLSPNIEKQINTTHFPSNFHFHSFLDRPNYFNVKGRRVIQRLKRLEKEIRPNVVFSIFGPTYWTPKAVHLMGFALGHLIYPDSPYFLTMSLKNKILWYIEGILKKYFIKINSSYFHVETEDVKIRLSKYLRIPEQNIFVVSNTYSSVFDVFNPSSNKILPNKAKNEFRLLCIASYYPHKNFEILNEVIPILLERGHNEIKFILTIESDYYNILFIDRVIRDQIINLGPIDSKDCPRLYYESDAVFVPSLLECFTANYPEAMRMKRPIITSNLSFARTLCAESALYFNPLDPVSIVDTIIKLYREENLRNNLVEKGSLQLIKFKTAEQRAKQYIDICLKISSK